MFVKIEVIILHLKDNLDISIWTSNKKYSSLLSLSTTLRQEGNISYIDINITTENPITFPEVTIDILFPFIDMHNLWTPCIHGHPKAMRNKGIPEWWPHYSSHISHVSPVGCFYNLTGQNKLAFAFSDAQNIVNVHAGAYEEECKGRLRFRLFSLENEVMSSYQASIRLDFEDISAFDAITNMASWYEDIISKKPMIVPQEALEPVYSTWYAFHQNLTQQEIEEQCVLAHKIGCKTVIIDDGWQTDDNNRGYTFCGDWEVSKSRFPNFKQHVATIQKMGMKYMLWFSVPFIGKQSNAWRSLENNMLFFNDTFGAGVVDPRYGKVRKFITDKIVDTVRKFNLDGLKLDFIDEFDMSFATGTALISDPERDTESLPKAVDILLSDIRNQLLALNPNIMIEFRQRYIGSYIRTVGNIFRVHDCPNDFNLNRMGIMDLRAFSKNTAVHSDMLTWSPEDSIESASLHFISALFSVPQISPNLKLLSNQHHQMIQHWLELWHSNKDILLEGHLNPLNPELHYPIISATKGTKRIITVHLCMPCTPLSDGVLDSLVINGTNTSSLMLNSNKSIWVTIQKFTPLGKEIKKEDMQLNRGINLVDIPVSGYLKITKN